jgi:hypothetical protein
MRRLNKVIPWYRWGTGYRPLVQMPKSTDAQAPYLKWCHISTQPTRICSFSFTLQVIPNINAMYINSYVVLFRD